MSACRRIGVVAPGNRLDTSVPDRVKAVAAELFRDRPDGPPQVLFHEQCFLTAGHFAGDDAERAAAFLEYANDPEIDAIWIARGGYGAGRLLNRVMPELGPAAREKTFLGYSDAGFLLGALKRAGVGRPVHGPMPTDINRSGGEDAVGRALGWLVDRDADCLERTVRDAPDTPAVAFNVTVLSHLCGTPWMPDLGGHVLMLEDIDEHMYRLDRSLWQILNSPECRKLAGIRLGRISQIPPNDPDFVLTETEMVQERCRAAGIAWLGNADIGHDSGNAVVPFGGVKKA